MPRGTGMSPTRRRNRRPNPSDPAALAARLPDHLREFEGFSDYRCYMAAVADWLNTQVPGVAEHSLTAAVSELAGVSMADWFKMRLGVSTPRKTMTKAD